MKVLHSYNYLGEQTLCAIEQAMTKVWTSLQTSDPSVDLLKDGELRTLLERSAQPFSHGDPGEIGRSRITHRLHPRREDVSIGTVVVAHQVGQR